MTVELLMGKEIYEPNPDAKVFLELYCDHSNEIRLHFKTQHGHIDGFYLLTIEKGDYLDERDGYYLNLWTSIKPTMKDISLTGFKRHLKVIGVDDL